MLCRFPHLVITLVLGLLVATAAPAHAFLKAGDTLPAFTVQGPNTPEDAATLKLPQGAPFALTDITTPYLLVQLFSMYCPHCQREAPHINAMYEDLVAGGHTNDMTLLGIGVGNSEFETNYFRDKYQVPFPLVPDKDYKVYDLTDRVGTPYYVLCKREGQDWKILFIQEGTFEDKESMLTTLQEKTGLPLLP